MRLIAFSTAALAGLLAGDLAQLDVRWLLGLALLALVATALVWHRHQRWRWLALMCCVAAMGGARASAFDASEADAINSAGANALSPYLGSSLRVRGQVVQAPTMSNGGRWELFQLDAEAVGAVGATTLAATDAAVRARVVGDPASPLSSLSLGDTVVLEGRLVADATAPNTRPPALLMPWLVERSEHPLPSTPIGLLSAARLRAEAGIRRYLPDPQASLAVGVLLGGSTGLDSDFRAQLQRSGLSHLLAIDGFKQVVVAGALSAVAVRAVGVRAATVPVLLGIATYTLLTGAHPSAVRAALMVGLASLAALTGRVADPLTSLLVAVLVMAGFDPPVLLNTGLQLSLSAVLGIILLWPRLRPWLRHLPRAVGEPIGLTLAVTLATLPVMLAVFAQVSLVSPIAHVLAVPLLPVVLVGAALLAIVSGVPLLGAAVAWLVWVPTTLLVQVARWFGDLPGAALSTGRLPPLASVGVAGCLLAWGLLGLPELAALRRRWAQAGWSGRSVVPSPVLGVASCAATAALLLVLRPDGQLHVETLGVGPGQAVFIRGPTGRTALVVGGAVDPIRLTSNVVARLAIWEHRLDALVAVDDAAASKIRPGLTAYAPEEVIRADRATSVDLGGGAVLDVYPSNGGAQPSVDVSFGNGWYPVLGEPHLASVSRTLTISSAFN